MVLITIYCHHLMLQDPILKVGIMENSLPRFSRKPNQHVRLALPVAVRVGSGVAINEAVIPSEYRSTTTKVRSTILFFCPFELFYKVV